MASTTKPSSLLLASLLCLLLLSEVGMLMAQVGQPGSAHTQGADECVKKCAYRCSKSWKPKMCNKTCVACCHRCPDHCVPKGPTAPRDSCHCYSQIKTHNKYKCP
ncbi:hypothetical protein V6N13_050879 [Hibiscus sabdariffa]|uniref:Uncharacterized protein n=1 Tax=Hibiscus sabdariffa TaxID=183260 RepID=A0ABR2PIS7_9ROSI